MESFNSAKRNFAGKSHSSNTIEVGPLTMKVDSSEHYDEDERAVLLTKYTQRCLQVHGCADIYAGTLCRASLIRSLLQSFT